MSSPLKFPSARQPVTDTDERGLQTFTRPWFLFFQTLYDRAGGAIGDGTGDVSESLFEDAGSSELVAALGIASDASQQFPQLPSELAELQRQVDSLSADNQQLRDLVAELAKEVDGMKQGAML